MKKWLVRCWYDQGPEDYCDFEIEAEDADAAFEQAKLVYYRGPEAIKVLGEVGEEEG
jgi:hypothetical protein